MKKIISNIKHWVKWNIITPICHALGIIAPTDWIDAYFYMSKAILPYMKQFKAHEKMGIPGMIYGDTYKQEMLDLGYTWNADTHCWEGEINGVKAEDVLSKKWDSIIDEIIFALEYTVNNEPTEDCMVPNPDYNPEQKEWMYSIDCPDHEGFKEIKFNDDYGKTKLDMDLLRAKEERVANGYKLLGEYWRNIWD